MPLEHMQTATVLPAAERRQAGQALRKIVPRSMHAHWVPAPGRRAPVAVLIESVRHRNASLLHIRYDRTVEPGVFRRQWKDEDGTTC